MNPSLLGSRQFDGAAYVDGLELIQELGTTTLSGGKPIFVSLNNISIFSSLESECKNTNHAPILLIDQTFPPVSMYTDRIRELREFGYHFAIRNLPVHCYEDYAPILSQMDYILIDCQKIDAVKASFYFRKLYPDICICASNPHGSDFGIKGACICKPQQGDDKSRVLTDNISRFGQVKIIFFNQIQKGNVIDLQGRYFMFASCDRHTENSVRQKQFLYLKEPFSVCRSHAAILY